jgi:hypothetical protein
MQSEAEQPEYIVTSQASTQTARKSYLQNDLLDQSLTLQKISTGVSEREIHNH